MTKKDLEAKIKSLEAERDMWRDMASKLIGMIPATPVNIFPQTNPVIIPQIVPYNPYPWTIYCDTTVQG